MSTTSTFRSLCSIAQWHKSIWMSYTWSHKYMLSHWLSVSRIILRSILLYACPHLPASLSPPILMMMMSHPVLYAAPICGTGTDCQTVNGDDGSVPCESYCMGINGGPWNGELPAEWNGAACAFTSDAKVSCRGPTTGQWSV